MSISLAQDGELYKVSARFAVKVTVSLFLNYSVLPQVDYPEDAEMHAFVKVLGARREGAVLEHRVEWEGGVEKWGATDAYAWAQVSEDVVLSACRSEPTVVDGLATEVVDSLIGEFILVSFTKKKKHLAKICTFVQPGVYILEYEDGKDNGRLDLLRAEHAWEVSSLSFE